MVGGLSSQRGQLLTAREKSEGKIIFPALVRKAKE